MNQLIIVTGCRITAEHQKGADNVLITLIEIRCVTQEEIRIEVEITVLHCFRIDTRCCRANHQQHWSLKVPMIRILLWIPALW